MALTTSRFNGQAEKRPLSAAFGNIENNSLYKILFDGSTTPDGKKSAVTAYLQGTSIAERPKALGEIGILHLYLQDQRALASQECVGLTRSGSDTEGLAKIDKLKEINKGMFGIYSILDIACKAAGDAFFGNHSIAKDIGNAYSDMERVYGSIVAVDTAPETKRDVKARSAPFKFRSR